MMTEQVNVCNEKIIIITIIIIIIIIIITVPSI